MVYSGPVHLETLRLYCDVVRLRSFSKGAEQNFVSQSAASQAVQQLEAQVGAPLIDRTKRPFAVSPQGKALYEACRSMLAAWEQAKAEVAAVKARLDGTVRVAAIYSVGLHDVSRPLRQHGAKANIVMEFDNIETIKQAIIIAAGVSVLPRHTVEKEAGIRTLATVPLGVPDLARPVGIIYRRQKPLTPTASRFVEMLKEASAVPAQAAAGDR